MHTDNPIYNILSTQNPEAFRVLTGGMELPGVYTCRSEELKALARTADMVFFPQESALPIYVLEFQAQQRSDIYQRLMIEMALLNQKHPAHPIQGIIIFTERRFDPQTEPFCHIVTSLYLEEIFADYSERDLQNPFSAVLLPLVLNDEQRLIDLCPTAFETLSAIENSLQSNTLRDVFIGWMTERFKDKTYQEIMTMLPQLTPLAETRSGRDLIAMTEAKLRRENERETQKLRQEAENARQEAHLAADHQARVETAKNMLEIINDNAVIAKTTGLELAEVQRLWAERG